MTFSFFRGRWGVRLLVFLALLLVLFVLRRGFFRSSAPQSAVPSGRTSAQIQQAWRSDVRAILREYDKDRNAARAREALLGLTVAREDQAAHLSLVLAFNAVSERQSSADELLARARNGFEGD